MGNCLDSCHTDNIEEDFEASRNGSSTVSEYSHPPPFESRIQREVHEEKADMISKSSPTFSSKVEKVGVVTVKKISSNKEEKAGGVRVKIVLSKQEAAQLLSKLEGGGDHGGVLEAAIKDLKRNSGGGGDQTSVVGHVPCCSIWRPVLESIPES